jgi:pre-mRNA-splicing factor SYF1
VAAVRGLPPKHPALQALANTFERSLVTMHKMPRVWLMYLQVCVETQETQRTH